MQLPTLFSTILLSGALTVVFLSPEVSSDEVTSAVTVEENGQQTAIQLTQTPPGERRRVRRRTRRRVRRRQERRETTMMPTQTIPGNVYSWSAMWA